MSNLDTIITFLPLFSYFGLLLSIKFRLWKNIIASIIVIVLTVVFGIIPIFPIGPLNFAAVSFYDWACNITVAAYLFALLYGSFGVMTGRYRAVMIGAAIVLCVCFASSML